MIKLRPDELRDLRADPYEMRNVVGEEENAATVELLAKELDPWVKRGNERPRLRGGGKLTSSEPGSYLCGDGRWQNLASCLYRTQPAHA